MFIHEDKREVCDINPGHEVDVYVRSTLRALSEVFWGERELQQACKEGAVTILGPPVYTRSASRWFPLSVLVNERDSGGGPRVRLRRLPRRGAAERRP